jgi:peptide/nickel transport system permease protein
VTRFFARRALRGLFTLWLTVSIVFVVFRLMGDPLDVLLPEDAPAQLRDDYRQRWGLDAPLPLQYARYFTSILRGDLGRSYLNGRPVVEVVGEELPNTLLLGVSAFVGATVLGLAGGALAALRRNRPLDRAVMALAVAGFSIPNYVLGTLLILIFAVELRWLPTSGSDTPAHLILPLATLALTSAARVARFTRSAVLDVLGEAYLRTARAKGLTERRILLRHTLQNAAIPVVTVLGAQLGYLVGGSAVVESVFAWPGIGRLLVQAVALRDLAVLQALILLIAASIVLAQLGVDLLYGLLDPRISIRADGGGS